MRRASAAPSATALTTGAGSFTPYSGAYQPGSTLTSRPGANSRASPGACTMLPPSDLESSTAPCASGARCQRWS